MGDWEREKREAQKANQSCVTDIVTEGSIHLGLGVAEEKKSQCPQRTEEGII